MAAEPPSAVKLPSSTATGTIPASASAERKPARRSIPAGIETGPEMCAMRRKPFSTR